MTVRHPLPPPFDDSVFPTRHALAAGISPGRLRARDLHRPLGINGLRGRSELAPDLWKVCRAAQARAAAIPYVSDGTAARLHGFPLPWRIAEENVLHLTYIEGHRAPLAHGIVGHQRKLAASELMTVAGVALTTPLRTLCDLAVRLTRTECTVIADFLVHEKSGLCTPSELAAAIRTYSGRRGRVLLREIPMLVDARSESPKENELRLLLTDAGLPRPLCGLEVFDETGRFVARLDMAYPDFKLAIEYEGDYHREKEQWRRDLARRRRLEALGWRYISVTQADLSEPRAVLADIRSALRRP